MAWRLKQPADTLWDSDKQRFHVFGVLDKIFLRHYVDQGTNGQVSPILWTSNT